MSDIIVKAESVSKKFCKSLKRSMAYGMQDIAKNAFGFSPKTDILKPQEFWAVDDVSFELRRGECLGLIGANGSGKSTLLKILSGIISPDKGRIEIRGKVGALIELGAGFHPMLTGRENVYINGSILGLSKKEIDKKFDEIVTFAELEEFINTPVKHYSSGMQMRLGFAIAAQMEPDILIIDEVLAVGDVGFKTKCFNVIADLTKKCAVIFVSHNMANIARLSTDILLLEVGRTAYHERDIQNGISKYFDQFGMSRGPRIGENIVLLKRCQVYGDNFGSAIVKHYRDLFIEIEFLFLQKHWTDVLILTFTNKEANNVAVTYLNISKEFFRINKSNNLTVKIPRIPFSSGNYSITVTFAKAFNRTLNGRVLSQYHSAASFKVIDSKTVTGIPIQIAGKIVQSVSKKALEV